MEEYAINTASFENLIISSSLKVSGSATIDFTPAAYVSGTFIGSGSFTNVQSNISLTRSFYTTQSGFFADIGKFTNNSGSHALIIGTSMNEISCSDAKVYLVTSQNTNNSDIFISGAWNRIDPLSSTGLYFTHDYAIEAMQSASVLNLRLIRIAGTITGSINVNILNVGNLGTSFTPLTTTGSSTPAVDVFPSAFVCIERRGMCISGSLIVSQSIVANNVSASLFGTASRSAADDGLSNAISVVSNALSVEISNRTSADNALSNAISVVSAEVASAKAYRAVNTAAQITISTSAGVTISGVSLALSTGRDYIFKFIIPFVTDTTKGLTIGVTGSANSPNNFVANTFNPAGSVGTGAQNYTPIFGTIGTFGNKVSAASTTNTLTGITLIAYIDGYINPANNGTIKCIIGSTAAAGSIRVQKGATLLLWKTS